MNIDPSGHLLSSFINLTICAVAVLARRAEARRGPYLPGECLDSTHSARMSMFVRTRYELALVLRRRFILN